jgi:hypothetical protein
VAQEALFDPAARAVFSIKRSYKSRRCLELALRHVNQPLHWLTSDAIRQTRSSTIFQQLAKFEVVDHRYRLTSE